MPRRRKQLDRLPPVSEDEWDGQVVQLATMLGWDSYHCFDSRRSAAGFPDRVLIRERVVFVELKRQSGRVSAAQAACLARLRAAGAEVYIWRPSQLAEVQAVLTRRGRW